MPRLTPNVIVVLEKYFALWAEREAEKAVDQVQLDRAERAKRHWLEHGLVKRSPY